MLTYVESSSILPKPTEKPWVLLLLCFFWLWLGIIGHDPWKPDEPYVMAVVEDMLHANNWLLPTIQNEPYFEYPPLYYWVAAGLVKVLPFLAAHDAARLATLLFMVLALLFSGMAGRNLIGRRHGRSVAMVLIGCIGLIETSHQLTPLAAGFTGITLAFYALSLTLCAPGLAGALLGLAITIIFLSLGFSELIWLISVVVLLPLFPAWRTRHYLMTILLAMLLAIPLMLIWPLTLERSFPAAFMVWLYKTMLVNPAHFDASHFFGQLTYYLSNAVWFSFPAWPLAAWTLYHNRTRLNQPRLQLPLLVISVMLVMLALHKHATLPHAIALLLPLSVLAAVELDYLRRGGAAFLNWFGLMAFGFFALLMWGGWLAMNFGWPPGLAARTQYFSPYYEPHISIWATSGAIIATLVWLWAVTRKHMRGRQATTNWAAGLTLLWGLGTTLWLPWFDAAKSYRPVVMQMMQALPEHVQCVAIAQQHQLARISWRYYAHLELIPFSPKQAVPCDYLLEVRYDNPSALPGWEVLWYGFRPREQNMTFVLLRRERVF